MHRPILISLCILLLSHFTVAVAQSAEFNYEGRVRSGGVPFDGNGLFKFALVSTDGSICYWANDGVTLTGNEPTSSVLIAVSSGFFSVIIGDATVSGMAAIDASIFNASDRVRLRVWFNDGAHGFQRLTPDRPVSNPGLLGLQSGQPLKLYVDPVLGDDRFSGIKSAKPKKTIQSAWDALPSLLRKDATIQLANGTYRQTARLSGKSIVGGKITLQGNLASPASVVLTGAPASDPTSASLNTSLNIINERDLQVSGIAFDHYANDISIDGQSTVAITTCTFTRYVGCGILVQNSYLTLVNCEVAHPLLPGQFNRGMFSPVNSVMVMQNCHFYDFDVAVDLGRNSQLSISGTLFEDGINYCIDARPAAGLTFSLPKSTIKNVGTAIRLNGCSWTTYNTLYVNYINVARLMETDSTCWIIN